ncbi:MAG: hypothetical protein JWP12_1672 [Bacteroidetes bacterium]|nr:hypothetical protein [Bacteroidota bacterium]
MKNFNYAAFLFLLLAMASCKHNRLDVDVSEIKITDFKINRLEQDLFKMDTSDIAGATKTMQAKYGPFYTTFISGILNNGGLRDSAYTYRVKQFITDRDMLETYHETQKVFPTTDTLKEQLTDLFRHFNYYFPQRPLPAVVTMISGYNYAVVTPDSTLAIGLEMYLGSNCPFYQMLALPKYKTAFMNKENIVPDAARAWMMKEFPYNMDKSDFLSEIVYVGKIMYLTDALLPAKINDTTKIQYTGKQMEYCVQNEFNVWSYFAAQKLLYSTDQAEIMKFTSDAPFTSALSKESAPRIGYWIGWQIVRQYIKNNPDVTIDQLMKESSAQKILEKAKYKPGK